VKGATAGTLTDALAPGAVALTVAALLVVAQALENGWRVGRTFL
jgi:hypothetical protein